MILPPRLTYAGDKNKALKLKSKALQFYNSLVNEVASGASLSTKRSKTLQDGSVLEVTFHTDGYGRKHGECKIIAPSGGNGLIEEGFVYTRDVSGDILNVVLFAHGSGFERNDRKLKSTNYGIIDWTDHKGVYLTWNGTHRYSPVRPELNPPTPNRDLFLYKNFSGLDLGLVEEWDGGGWVNAGITGVIAGAAIIKGLTVVFVWSHSGSPFGGSLKVYFINGKRMIGPALTRLSGVTRLLQCVAISPDGTKACTIATFEENGYDRESILIDWSISINATTLEYNVTTESAVHQSITDVPMWDDTGGGFTRLAKRVVVAVDYDKASVKKDFWIETAATTTADFVGLNSFNATINYNDQYTVTLSDSDYYDNVDDLTLAHSYDFILIDTLDLRHDVFAYTQFIEDIEVGGNFVIEKAYWLHVGELLLRYKGGEFLYGTFPDNVKIAEGHTTPIHHYLFRYNRHRNKYEQAYLPIYYFLFMQQIQQNNQDAWTIADTNYDGTLSAIPEDNTIDEPEVLFRVNTTLIDKFGNKIIMFSPVRGVLSNVFTGTMAAEPETGGLFFNRDAPVIIKLDKHNRYYESGVRSAEAATAYQILENESQILELKGVV